MKRILAVLSAAALLFALAACGTTKTPVEVESSTESVTETAPETTMPENGRYSEVTSFTAFIPDGWSRLVYKGDGNRMELYQIPSLPDKTNDTPMIKIILDEHEATLETVQNNVKSLLRNHEGAKQGKNMKIDGHDFAVVYYVDAQQKHGYFVYNGLVGNRVAVITLRGISPNNEEAKEILNGLSFH